MFDEGSPKESHRLLFAIAIVAGLVMIVASFDASVTFRTQGREIELTAGADWLTLSGVAHVALLVAWQRGWIADNWPLALAAAICAFALLFLAGDWYRGWQWRHESDVVVTPLFYAGAAAALTAATTCVIGFIRPVREQSSAHGPWARRR